MASWSTLKAAIADAIKTNGNQEITGQILQNTLNSIVSSVGENATFAGVAFLDTNPGDPDGPVFYLAFTEGVYPNFNGVTLVSNELAVLSNLDNGSWAKQVISSQNISPADIDEIRNVLSISEENPSYNGKDTYFLKSADTFLEADKILDNNVYKAQQSATNLNGQILPFAKICVNLNTSVDDLPDGSIVYVMSLKKFRYVDNGVITGAMVAKYNTDNDAYIADDKLFLLTLTGLLYCSDANNELVAYVPFEPSLPVAGSEDISVFKGISTTKTVLLNNNLVCPKVILGFKAWLSDSVFQFRQDYYEKEDSLMALLMSENNSVGDSVEVDLGLYFSGSAVDNNVLPENVLQRVIFRRTANDKIEAVVPIEYNGRLYKFKIKGTQEVDIAEGVVSRYFDITYFEKVIPRMFIDQFNAAVGSNGKYDPANAPDDEHIFYLNTLWLTYEEAVIAMAHINEVYIYGAGTMQDINIRTNILSAKSIPASWGWSIVRLTGVCCMNNTIEVLNMGDILIYSEDRLYLFAHNCSKLHTIIGQIDLSLVTQISFTAFESTPKLQNIELYKLRASINFKNCSLLSFDSLQFIVDTAINTSAITIIVHPDVYAKLINDTTNAAASALTEEELAYWHELLMAAIQKDIEFATTV